MKTTLTAAAVAAFAIIGGIFGIAAPALAQTNTPDTATPGMSMDMGGGDMMTMMLEMASQNDTATSDTTDGISNIAGFNAMLHMVMLNGSAMHSHEISNFTQVGDATFNGDTNSTTITGTATITMREGPVEDVQTTIEIAQDKVIAISPDPAALENHFGDTPIYGVVVSPEMIEQMMMSYGDMGGMMNSSGAM